MSRADHIALAACLAAAGLLAPAAASAYCRQTTHEDNTCEPDPGIPLFWEGNCVSYTLHEAGSDDLPFDVVANVVAQSFDAWEDAALPGESACSYLTFEATRPATCDDIGYRQDAGNMNLVVFRETGWQIDQGHTPAAIGLTTVLYDPDSGRILSTDMELNGEFFTFTDSTIEIDTDLGNTVTHEAGHVLSLAHSDVPTATMFAQSSSGETLKSTLHEDDIHGVCDAYPIAQDPGVCLDAINGLDTECLPPEPGCCRVAGAGRGNPIGTAIAAGVLLLACLRRRQHRPRPR